MNLKDVLEKINNSFREVSNYEGGAKEDSIKKYFSLLTDLYDERIIGSRTLAYYVTSTIQYRDSIQQNNDLFRRITGTAGILELPDSQVTAKKIDRNSLERQLFTDISAFISK